MSLRPDSTGTSPRFGGSISYDLNAWYRWGRTEREREKKRKLYAPRYRYDYNPAKWTGLGGKMIGAAWKTVFPTSSDWQSDWSWDMEPGTNTFDPAGGRQRKSEYIRAGGTVGVTRKDQLKYGAPQVSRGTSAPSGRFQDITPIAYTPEPENWATLDPNDKQIPEYERQRIPIPRQPRKRVKDPFLRSRIGPERRPLPYTQKKRPTPQRAPQRQAPQDRIGPEIPPPKTVARRKTARGYRCPNGYRWNGTACVRVNKYGKPRRSSRQVFLDKWSRQWVARHQRRWAPGRIRNLRKSVNWYKYLKGTPLEKPWLLWHFNKWNNQRKWYNRYHRRRGILRR